MNLGTYPLAASMINQLNRVDMVANNIANTKTAGFKEERLSEGSFNYYMKQAQAKKEPINEMSKVVNTTPKIDTKYINGTVGNIITSGNNLDFAIKEPNLYFKVKDDKENILFTRDGTFSNQGGFLVNKNGYKVLNTNNEPILIDEQNSFTNNIGLIKTELTNIEKIGNNNYKLKDENQMTNVINNSDKLYQGAIESSNVNAVQSMITLIEAHRAFEQAQKAVTGLGDLSTTLIDKIGSVR